MRRDLMSATAKEAPGGRRPLRVLLVEDSEADAALLADTLARGGFRPCWQRVESRQAMQQALQRQAWDLILADHALPSFSATEALRLVKSRGWDVPFIIVSGQIDEDTAVGAMRAGAHDYVMKERLARLVPAVERELREAQTRRARKESREALRRIHEELELRVEQRTEALKAANFKLQRVLEERRRLENELLEIAENERRRIGLDLHDDLGQKLTGALFMIKALERRLAAEAHTCAADARKIQTLIEQLTHHTHNLAHQFSALDLRGDDLSSVLSDLAGNVKKLFEIGCTFTLKGARRTLPQDTTTQLYKIAQEAISNAIKHGKATRVSIRLVTNRDRLHLTIRNNGLPFCAPADAKARLGLRIMNYRASTISANLQIQPLPRRGTVVRCELPLKNGRPAGVPGSARPPRSARSSADSRLAARVAATVREKSESKLAGRTA